jgi:hypothetical protein
MRSLRWELLKWKDASQDSGKDSFVEENQLPTGYRRVTVEGMKSGV